jgi:NAD(P)-dependent dehydrogenase (short-subunit alcohol dehydrogenase family)
MPGIDGSRILVAGGAHRVGRAIALDLAEAGADVAISYHSSESAAMETRHRIAALGRRTAVVQADVADPTTATHLLDRAAEALGGVDVYVHCPSGGFVPRRPQLVDEQLWDAAMDSTAKGFFFAAQAAHRLMSGAGGGVIVAITDVAGLQPWPAFAPHGAAKAAQIHLVKTLALAWGREGVRVCGVAPGPVLMPDGIAGNPDETALGRLGSPEDVCQAVRFCIEADFVTGQNVITDGGRLLRP